MKKYANKMLITLSFIYIAFCALTSIELIDAKIARKDAITNNLKKREKEHINKIIEQWQKEQSKTN